MIIVEEMCDDRTNRQLERAEWSPRSLGFIGMHAFDCDAHHYDSAKDPMIDQLSQENEQLRTDNAAL